jgi:hypothetical protein
MGLSAWLVALAFVAPAIGHKLTPFDLDHATWSGLLAVSTFFLSIVQLKVDWKGKSDSHGRALYSFAEVKREAGILLATDGCPAEDEIRRVLTRFDLANAVCVPIPEGQFLLQKRRHRSKVALSKYLDTHPTASVTLARLKLWWRDNLGEGEKS